MPDLIPVVDLFAGPGGLGEGFASFTDSGGRPLFRVCLSIEKDDTAHQTLMLRAFYRQFSRNSVPDSYYEYLRGKISRKTLFRRYRIEAKRARREAWHAELGRTDHESVKRRIKNSLSIRNKKAWVLIGGPPCQAYSIAGRARMAEQRKNNLEEYEKDERHYLYREYLRIIADHKPPVFVMENVKGILSSTVKGKKIFHQILSDLQTPRLAINSYARGLYKRKGPTYKIFPLVRGQDLLTGFESYDPSDYIIEAEQFGIPQARHRVILLGIRADIPIIPEKLIQQPTVSVKEVISDLPALRSTVSRGNDSDEEWIRSLESIKNLAWFENGFKVKDAKLWAEMSSVVKQINHSSLDSGTEFIACELDGKAIPKVLREWYLDKRLGGVCNHAARGHMPSDLHRYLFVSCFGKLYGRSPELRDFPKRLLPDHENVEDALEGSFFSDRFRVQLYNKPSSTVTSHISKDGHYYIHPDPTQCRSLTVREAARIQTFPDNYFFEGARTFQYQQVGNAVPPYLAHQIAEIVHKVLQEAEDQDYI